MNKKFCFAIALMLIGAILLVGFNVALAIDVSESAIGMTITTGILSFVFLIVGLLWSIIELFYQPKK